MTTSKGSFNFLGCAALLVCNLAFGEGLKWSVTPKTIQPGERARLEIEIPLAELGIKDLDEDTILPQMRDDLLNDAKAIMILERDFRRERDALVWRYDITAYEKGKPNIPPVEIRLGPLSFSTEATPLEVLSTRQPDDTALREEYGPATYPIRWLLLLIVAVLGGIGAAAWRFGRPYYRAYMRRFHTAPVVHAAPKEKPDEWLRKRLAVIREKLAAAGEDAAANDIIVDDIALAIREYYARREGRPVEAWTTREFRARMQTVDRAQKICPVFDRCDEWKFTGNLALSPRAIATASLDESEKILLA
jgi:hypothetical protein